MKTWEDGVKDSIRIIQDRLDFLKSFDRPNSGARSVPAALHSLEEALIFLQAMLERGTYSSSSVLD